MSVIDTLKPAEILTRIKLEPTPVVTWYSPTERVELSGPVMARWATKAANFLTEEYDFAPGSTLRCDLPLHWRALGWALGTLLTGATLSFSDDDADVLVTYRPEAWQDVAIGEVLAQPLPALALQWDGPPLPAMVEDASTGFMASADVLGPMPAATPDALAVDDPAVTHGELATYLAGGGAKRIAFTPSSDLHMVRTCLQAWDARGSAVVVMEGVEAAAIAAQENATLL